MSQQLNESGTCPEVIDTSGYVNQAKTWLLNALGTFTTTRLLSLIAHYTTLITKPVIKELIRASENKMFVKGGYDEIWNHDFRNKVWPHFAEDEIARWIKEGPDDHTNDLREVRALSDIYYTHINDMTTWQRLFEIYVRLFRVSDSPQTVRDAMKLITLKFPDMPEDFFDSSKVLLERGSVNEDNTLTVSRVLETNASKTFEVLANGLFSQCDGNVEFILQSPTKLRPEQHGVCHLHVVLHMFKSCSYTLFALTSPLFGSFFNGEIHIRVGVITPTRRSKGTEYMSLADIKP